MSERKKHEMIRDLAEQVMLHKQLYYRGEPSISDHEYDRLEMELQKLDPQHPALEFVGEQIDSKSEKIAHDTPMLSLEKTYSEDDLQAWVGDNAVIGMYKIDGNSLSLIYEDGKLVCAKTRGNGRIGEKVTDKIMWVDEIPKHLATEGKVEIRGELYCREDEFLKLVREFEALGLEPPTNPRNTVAGLLGRKNHYHLCRYFQFFAFDILTPQKKWNHISEEIATLESWGFCVPYPQICKTWKDIKSYLDQVKVAINEGEIGLDGAVFSFDDLSLHAELGSTAHHPRYRLSFKWQGATAVTTIERIEWFTSRAGIITPVAVIRPVELSGATITNVTLHNAAHVETLHLKAGDEIEIVRSGEVIPKFLRVVEAAPGSVNLPTSCPSCGSQCTKDEVRLSCTNGKNCPAQRLGRILNWIQCVEIDDLSEKRVQQMLDHGLIQDLTDLYLVTIEQLLQLPQTKEKLANKIWQNIRSSKNCALSQMLNGLGITGMGLTSWEKLIAHFGDLESLRDASEEQIIAVDGFAEKSAQQCVAGLKTHQSTIDRLLSLGFTPRVPQVSNHNLRGLSIAITGTLSVPRDEIEALIKASGGVPSSSVSKNTHAVVTGDPSSTSSKMKKARDLGIQIWSEKDLRQACQG